MKKTSILVFALIASTFAANCAIGPVNGVLFTSNKFPGEINSANDVPSSKSGEGCQHLVLGLVSFGNAGAGSVALANGISRISTIDHSTLNVLQVVYSRYCTIVYGQ